jgi:hypothetical protein
MAEARVEDNPWHPVQADRHASTSHHPEIHLEPRANAVILADRALEIDDSSPFSMCSERLRPVEDRFTLTSALASCLSASFILEGDAP